MVSFYHLVIFSSSLFYKLTCLSSDFICIWVLDFVCFGQTDFALVNFVCVSIWSRIGASLNHVVGRVFDLVVHGFILNESRLKILLQV